MRHASLVVSGLTVMLLGVLAISSTITAAQDTAPAAESRGFVGSWRAVVTPPDGSSFRSLITLGADGTATTSNQPVQPALPGSSGQVIFASAGHGVWAADSNTAHLTFVVLLADGQGNFVGTATSRATLTLDADGQAFRGEGAATIADPAGTTVATVPVTVKAERIAVEAPGTPAATTGRLTSQLMPTSSLQAILHGQRNRLMGGG